MKSIVLLLFVSKAFSLCQLTKSSNEHNVTNSSNGTIFETIQTVEPENIAKLFHSLNYLDAANDYRTTPYTYNFTLLWISGPVKDIMTIRNIWLARPSLNKSHGSYRFRDNKLRLYSGQFHVNLSGEMSFEQNWAFNGYFELVAHFRDFTICAIRQPNTTGNSFLIEDVQYDQLDITGGGIVNYPSMGMCLKRILPSIFRTHMNRNEKFHRALDEIYDKYTHQQTSTTSSSLKTNGLTASTKQLLAEPMVHFDKPVATQEESENFTVFLSNTNAIDQRNNRSTSFPSIHELESSTGQNPTEKLPKSNKPTVNTQKLHKNSTLFDDSAYTTNQILDKDQKITNINNYHYHISLHDININLLSGNPNYSDKIQCAPAINSEFTHRINVSPSGKISSKTNETELIGVTFHFKYPSVNLSSIKSRNYEKNDSCEFQIRNNRDMRIELTPLMNTTGSKEQHKIQKRIAATMMSMTKDRIIHTLKPMICIPFDVCTQTANMIDDYFRKFVDIVLKKCSLRKNTTGSTMKYNI